MKLEIYHNREGYFTQYDCGCTSDYYKRKEDIPKRCAEHKENKNGTLRPEKR